MEIADQARNEDSIGLRNLLYTILFQEDFISLLSDNFEYDMINHLGNIMVTFDDRNYDGTIDILATGTQSEILGRQHYYSFGERGCASHTKWLVAEVKRSVCPADRHGRSRSDSEVITLHAKKHEVLMRKDIDDSYSYQHNVTVDLYQWYGMPPTGYDQQRFRYNSKEMHKGSRLLDYGFRYYSAEIGRFTGVDPISDQYPHVTGYNYAENEPVGNIDLWGLQALTAKYGNIMNKQSTSSKPGPASIMINEYSASVKTLAGAAGAAGVAVGGAIGGAFESFFNMISGSASSNGFENLSNFDVLGGIQQDRMGSADKIVDLKEFPWLKGVGGASPLLPRLIQNAKTVSDGVDVAKSVSEIRTNKRHNNDFEIKDLNIGDTIQNDDYKLFKVTDLSIKDTQNSAKMQPIEK